MIPLFAVAQPAWLNEVSSAIETRHHFYPTKWVCTGDTMRVDTTEQNGIIVLLDGYWITCQEISNDIWQWYVLQLHEKAPEPLKPATSRTAAQIEELCRQLNLSTHGTWRLPTLKEWCFAYHGGLFSEGYRFAGSNRQEWVAWCKKNSGGKLHDATQLIANELGLYDMSGNAAEMVTEGDSIVFVGGSCLDDMEAPSPTPPPEVCGFRLAMPQPLWFDKEGQRIYR